MIEITIKRFQDNQTSDQTYRVDESKTLLESLQKIKSDEDATLTFKSGCESGICGSCAVRVNAREVLACKYRPSEGDYIEALRFFEPIRDLVVKSNSYEMIQKTKAYHTSQQTISDNLYTIQSDCILCGSCLSACPVYDANPNFLAPFIYSKVQKIALSGKEPTMVPQLGAVQESGIWECTSCMACTMVCPQGLDPKGDVDQLKNSSIMNGFEAKMPPMQGFDNSGFGGGFDPSQFGGFQP